MLMNLGVQKTTISQYYLLSPFQTSYSVPTSKTTPSRLAFLKYKRGSMEPCTPACVLVLFISFAVLICCWQVTKIKANLNQVQVVIICSHEPGWHSTVWSGVGPTINTQEGVSVPSFTKFKHYQGPLRNVFHISSTCLILCPSHHLTYHT